MNYNEAVYEIEEIPKFSAKNPLEKTKGFYRFIRDKYKFKEEALGRIIHVAGTNGKGSVCSFLNSICMEAGLKTGMFISPHLITTRERFAINNEICSEDEFVQTYFQLKEAVKEYKKVNAEYIPTYFETLFFMMIFMFKDKNLDYLILETGLGGRLDTTNVIEKPILTVITEVGMDHMAYLGDTFEKIAAEKAGIIKQGVPLAFIDRRPETTNIIENCAKSLGVNYIKTSKNDTVISRITKKSIDFSVSNRYYGYNEINININAIYQVENASLAIASVYLLKDKRIGNKAVLDGISRMKWPGRMEEIRPNVYVDGAHNEDGIIAFAETLDTLWKNDECTIVFSAVSDKDYEHMIEKICDLSCVKNIIVTHIPGSRGASTQDLKSKFERYTNKELIVCEKVEEAVDSALAIQARGEKQTIFFVGSLYLVGMIKDYLCEEGLDNDKF